mgnify:CR=1 FL=1|jgi:hypothetical protein
MYVIVNFFNETSEYEQFDVSMNSPKPKRKSWLRAAMKTVSYLSYIPTTFSVAKYLLKNSILS